MRKVVIDKRKISMLTAETGFVPISFDLDKLDDKIENKITDDQRKLLGEISLLETEEDMAKDIIKDFQSEGWRCIRRENGGS